MQSKDSPADLGGKMDDLDYRLYEMEKLCTFVCDVANGAPVRAQLDQIQAETLVAVFAMIAERLGGARAAFYKIRQVCLPPAGGRAASRRRHDDEIDSSGAQPT